jgi:tripartite ATP-independent transporter DctM subunit
MIRIGRIPVEGWRDLGRVLTRALRTMANVTFVIAMAAPFAWLMSYERVPVALAESLLALSDNPIVILLILNVLLLGLGAIMDMAPLILITTPIFLPVVVGLGVDPVQFGIIMMMNLGLGLCTPPVGACLFVGCAVGGERIENVVRTIWPFYAAILVALMLTTYIPALSLWLPRVVFGYGA